MIKGRLSLEESFMAFIQMNLLSKSLMRTVPVNVILPVDKMVFPGMPER